MHSIERYGIVALLFLVVTVVAVLMWDGGKDKKKGDMAAAVTPAAVRAAERAASERPASERDAGRRLSLVAESQPGPLARQPQRGATDATGEPEAPNGELDSKPAPLGSQAEPLHAPAEAQPATGTPREEPAREAIVGRAAAPATHGYTVRSGDTLSEIAQRELGSARRWQEIVAANPGLDPGRLQVGKTIRIPGAEPASGARAASAPVKAEKGPASAPSDEPRTWKVGKGENLWKIAARALGDGKRWPEIAALNPRVNPDKLVLGQVLNLPTGSARKAAPAAKTGERPTLVASSVGERSAPRGGKVR